MKKSADPRGASLVMTTTPDLRVCELNSNTLTMVSLAMFEDDLASGRRGRTTVSLSCI